MTIDCNKALKKIENICSRSEKCSFDIKQKLIAWQIEYDEIDEIIASLIEQDFINEERFSKAFANDKFKFNKWGKNKISFALRQKQINEINISNAIKSISQKKYIAMMSSELNLKVKSINGDVYTVKAKLLNFAQSRGYETEIVYSLPLFRSL